MPLPSRFSFLDQWMLGRIYAAAGNPPVQLKLGEIAEAGPGEASSLGSIVFADRRALRSLLWDAEMGFGDGYAEGRIAIEGDPVAILEALYLSSENANHHDWYSDIVSRLLKFAQRNTMRGAQKNIHSHYDLSNEFYRLWLDKQMVYTCAYFANPEATLEEAQAAKMDHVCRKLRLQPGERVVEAGCGWGALALHMAKNYGVNVKAYNISREQVLYARERARELKLDGQVEFLQEDYRSISAECDAFVSVGMLEHVGLEHYGELGETINRGLSKTGRGLLHFIGRSRAMPFSTWTRKRIFPGAYAPTLGQAAKILEPWSFSVLDVENLRPHYAKTLEHWLARFENSRQQVTNMFGEQFERMWRLYLAGAIAGFRAGTLQLFQIVFARTACGQIPWTRDHLYQREEQEEREVRWMHATS